jgi:hypothetical protein
MKNLIQAVKTAAHNQRVNFATTTTKVVPNKKKIVKPFRWKG